MKGVSCLDHLSCVTNVTNVPSLVRDLPVGARLHQFWKKMGSPRRQPQNCNSVQIRLYSSLPVLAKFHLVTHHHKLLCQSPQAPLPDGGTIASAFEQKCSRTSNNSNISGLLQPTFPGSKPNNQWKPILDLSTLNQFYRTVIQTGDSRDNKNLLASRGVGYLCRFQRRILPHTNSEPVQEVYAFSRPGSVLLIQSNAIWSVHSTHGVYSSGKRVQVSCTTKGYNDLPVARRLVGQSQIPPNLSPAYTNRSDYFSGPRLAGQPGEIRSGPQTSI